MTICIFFLITLPSQQRYYLCELTSPPGTLPKDHYLIEIQEMKAKDTEKQILRRLRNGDRKAFDIVYNQWVGYVYNFINKILFDKSLSEDLTQDLFMKLWDNRDKINPELNFQAWLFTIARNLVYQEGRRMILGSIYAENAQKTESAEGNTTEEMTDYYFTSNGVNHLIDKLPPARKRIYLMNKHQGLSVKEIALQLGLSEKTVETQLYNANKFMRSHLKDFNIVLIFLAIATQY